MYVCVHVCSHCVHLLLSFLDNALGQERPHVSKEMAQSVGSLFDPEYHSDMPLPNPECRPVASPVPLPDGGLSDNLRFVSDFVTGKMDTASPPGVEGVVAQSALTEGEHTNLYVIAYTYIYTL